MIAPTIITVPKEELAAAKEIAASLFFKSVFGEAGGVNGLNFLIALSAFGNLISVLLGQSRLLRECGRQGVLPYPRFWASTRPFGTPLGPYFVEWLVTIVMILAPPAGDAFAFGTLGKKGEIPIPTGLFSRENPEN